MATTVDRATYSSLTDDIVEDVSNKAEAEIIKPEQYRNWILRAQQELCKRLNIFEQYAFSLTEEVTDYALQDRPLITAATNADPAVITAAAHGLANEDRINIRDAEGNTAINGAMQVSNVTTDTFRVNKYADVEDASNETPINISAKDHPFVTGDLVTITGVLGNTAANVSLNAITKVDADNFTLDAVAGNGDYTSGGLALKIVAGSGTYLYGGQFWKTGELPTYVRNIVGIRRAWSDVYRTVKMVGEVDLMNDQIFQSFGLTQSGYNVPVEASFITVNGDRFLHFFSRPLADEDAILICQIEVVPERYFTANLNSKISLRSTYNEAIKSYVKAKLYEKLGGGSQVSFYQNQFDSQVRNLRGITVGSTRIKMSYS